MNKQQTYTGWKRAVYRYFASIEFDAPNRSLGFYGNGDIAGAQLWQDGKPFRQIGEWDGAQGEVMPLLETVDKTQA